MTLIEWRNEYSTGISGVDYEHEELVKQVNSIYKMLDNSSDKANIINCLGDIYGSISSHFALEEKWMERNNYDQYAEHRKDHERLLDDIGDITDEVEANDTLNAEQLRSKLNDWFLIHFKTHDARLHQAEQNK